MKKIIGFILLLALVSPKGLLALTYEERGERYRQQVAEEVKRRHELNLVRAQEEVLAKRIELGTEKTEINTIQATEVSTTAQAVGKGNLCSGDGC